VNLPLIHNLSVLQVHAVQRVRIVGILQYHVRVLRVQHDLLRAEQLALRRLDLRYVGGKLQMVVGSVLEDTNLRSSDDKRPIMLVANSKLRVDIAILVAGDNVVF
jgi:hypothetical protein